MSNGTFQKKLMVTLTEEEIAERGSEMAQETMARLHLELERSAINRKIKPHKERAESLAAIIDAGEEERDVDCLWRYDWPANLRYLIRLDTGEILEQEVIPPNMKQIDMFETPATVVRKPAEVGMFLPCLPYVNCAFVNSGNSCAPAFCGKSKPLPVSCDCPEAERIVESNVITCGLCKRVIKAAPIERESQPAEKSKSKKKKAVKEEGEPTSDVTSASEVSTTVEEKTDNVVEVSKDFTETIDKNRRCCMPSDRATVMQGDIRVMFCSVCGLVHRKEDTSTTSSMGNHPRLDFPIGEKISFVGDDDWPAPPGANQ